jgi:hypothetical protein
VAAESEQRGTPPAHATGAVRFVAVDDIAVDETFRLRPDGDVSQLATSFGRLGQLAPVELRPWPGAGSDGPQWQVISGFRRLAAVRMLARERVLARFHHELCDEDAWGLALSEALLHQPLTGDELEALRARLRASGVASWAEELVDEARVSAPVAAELRERFYDFLTAVATQPPPSPQPSPLQEAGKEVSEPATSTPAPAEPSQSRLDETQPGVRLDETRPGVHRDERVQGSTPTATAAEQTVPDTATVPPDPDAPPGSLAEGKREEQEYVEVTPEELVQDLAIRLSALNQDLATAVEAWKDLPAEGRMVIVDQARYVVALLPFMETQE